MATDADMAAGSSISSLWSSFWPIINTAAILFVVIVAVEFLRSKVTVWYKQHKYLRSLPSMKYSPIFGNLHQVSSESEAQLEVVRTMMEGIHPKFCVFWTTPVTPTFVIYHPDFMRAVTATNPSVSIKPRGSGKGYEFGIPWIGEGLITANGKPWSRSRKLLNPAFHSDVLKNYVETFNQCADKVIVQLDELAESGGSFDVFPLVTNFSLEVTMKCILGDHQADVIGSKDGNHPYAKAVHELNETWLRRYWNPLTWPDWIFRVTRRGQSFYRQCDFVHQIADDIIHKRKEKMAKGDVPQTKRLDFIDILLSARDDDGDPMTPEEIRQQVDSFMFAAHDTTSTAISFNIYNLANHQDYQKKIQQEVDDVMDGRNTDDVMWDDMPRFKMASLCTKESMRLFAPVPLLGRILTKDIQVDGVTIPSDTVILLGTVHMHRNPAVWDRPHDFVPERFLDESIDKFAYVPFSAGPRNCIGQNFAKMEKHVILSKIFHRYNVQLAPGYKEPIRNIMSPVMKSENGIWLTLERREAKR